MEENNQARIHASEKKVSLTEEMREKLQRKDRKDRKNEGADTAAPSGSSSQKRQEPKLSEKEEISDFVKTAIVAVLLAVFIRTFFYEPFNIPSGSMLPTLKVGDYLFVSKPAYGYSRYSFPFGIIPYEGRFGGELPKRGDIAVFKLPANTSVDYIKRVIGLPGDTIQVVRGRLYINGKRVKRVPIGLIEESGIMEYTETLPNGVEHSIYEVSDVEPLDNTEKFTVPPGHYFMMGDNRDNSQDSRVMDHVGFVPLENFVGRADILFYSTNGSAKIYQPWKWHKTIRYGRIFKKIGRGKPET